ncbi:enoyl-CoA hydratase [Atopomonas sediminilitoris]|uniref:enoyl-CoA hydratase n=1 Tax=Atopomonas sediminilitoris TaxID=2919919 RepID=UPI001F4DF018|nr:enoyl-CoA hydratase [Atopomonas sediminilitoris]MCJ8168688.1 enoyl-CoA hydratase [Atopomonas sediminilitoris]
MSQPILITHEQGVLTLSFNRAEKKNALTADMYRLLGQALREADADSAVRAVLLQGDAHCFTSGNDVQDFLQAPPNGPDAPVFLFMQALLECRKPVVAAVNGSAVGIGTTLLLHCDLVFVGPEAKLRMPFVNLGLCPEYGSSLLVPLRLGHAKAAQLLLLGEAFDAEQTVALGFANACLSSGEACLAHAREQALRFTQLAPQAVMQTKALMRAPYLEQLKQVIAEEGELFVKRLRSPEAMEALSAFMQHRAPDFSRFA